MRVVVGVEEVYLSRGVVIDGSDDGSGLFCRGRVFKKWRTNQLQIFLDDAVPSTNQQATTHDCKLHTTQRHQKWTI